MKGGGRRDLMRSFLIATLAFVALSAGAASAQSPVSCDVAPTAVCEDAEVAALESERSALVAQLSAADPAHAALANEQTWVDGLGACGEDAACYRTAYLNHNETLRQAAAGLPAVAATDPALEIPADAPTVEEQTAIDEVQAERLREAAEEARDNTPARIGDDVYVPAGLPGWGFWTMIGLSLFVFWWLMRTMKRNREEIRAEEARLRNAGFR
jgi:uncharacterized protein